MLTTLLASVSSMSEVVVNNGGIPGLVWWAIVFFVIALIAYVLGARGVAGMSAGVGRTLLFVFLVLAILFAIIGFVQRNTY